MLENRLNADGSAYLDKPYSPTSVHRQIIGAIILVAMLTTAFKKGFCALSPILCRTEFNRRLS